MSDPRSQALALILNLRNVAIHHHRTCGEPDCGVSLIALRQTASTLKASLERGEEEEGERLTANWPR